MLTLNRYIATRTVKAILIAFIVVISVIMLVDFVEATRNLDAGTELSSGEILFLTALKAPQLIEETIPFVILFGVMGALNALNKRSELIVLRASGLSAWRFLVPAIIVTAMIGVFWSALLNPLASRALDMRENLLAATYKDGDTSVQSQDIWLRDGSEYEQTVIYAESADIYKRTLYNAEFNVFETGTDGTLNFVKRFDAKQAQLLTSNYWQLTDVIENTIDTQTEVQSAVSWPTRITVKDFEKIGENKSSPSFWQMPGEIAKLRAAGFSTSGLRLQFHKLLALPFTLIAMTLIAAGVSMNLTREGGTLRLLLIGASVGFAVFFIQNIIKAFGETGVINVVFAAWIIPIIVLLSGIIYLSIIEDG